MKLQMKQGEKWAAADSGCPVIGATGDDRATRWND